MSLFLSNDLHARLASIPEQPRTRPMFRHDQPRQYIFRAMNARTARISSGDTVSRGRSLRPGRGMYSKPRTVSLEHLSNRATSLKLHPQRNLKWEAIAIRHLRCSLLWRVGSGLAFSPHA